jgi:hypothetical protein
MEEPCVINVEVGLTKCYQVLPRARIVQLANTLPHWVELLIVISAPLAHFLEKRRTTPFQTVKDVELENFQMFQVPLALRHVPFAMQASTKWQRVLQVAHFVLSVLLERRRGMCKRLYY